MKLEFENERTSLFETHERNMVDIKYLYEKENEVINQRLEKAHLQIKALELMLE
jgi:hypothetical protein